MTGLKETIARIWASRTAAVYRRLDRNPGFYQQYWFKKIIRRAKNTAFGRDHGFKYIESYEDFKKNVPLADYEAFRPYIERIIQGEKNVLWPGRPLYFAKTSGTTSGTKYIPISKASIPFHISAARDMLLLYIYRSGNSAILRGKMIFLQGSPKLDNAGGIPTGRLSGIAAHYVPGYLQSNRLPGWETNIIEDWDTKVEKIIDETVGQPMTVFSGIPSWIIHYFERVTERTGKTVGEVFPEFSLFISGGTAFEPYRAKFEKLVGRSVDLLETYPASEGFIAFSDDYQRRDLRLLFNHGIFYEFVPSEQVFQHNPERLTLDQVETGRDYAVVLTTNAGLFAYLIGDTVRFTSTNPYRLEVTGRVKHFISAFGEHVIAKEIETAMTEALAGSDAEVAEFSVAPQVTPASGLPYHEWFVEFRRMPSSIEKFAGIIDESMQKQNIYYRDLIKGKILRPAVITPVKKGAFNRYMASVGRLGGQNKIPRLKNDRELADFFEKNNEIPINP